MDRLRIKRARARTHTHTHIHAYMHTHTLIPTHIHTLSHANTHFDAALRRLDTPTTSARTTRVLRRYSTSPTKHCADFSGTTCLLRWCTQLRRHVPFYSLALLRQLRRGCTYSIPATSALTSARPRVREHSGNFACTIKTRHLFPSAVSGKGLHVATVGVSEPHGHGAPLACHDTTHAQDSRLLR